MTHRDRAGAPVTAQRKSGDVGKVGRTVRLRADMDKMPPIDPGDGHMVPAVATR